jgi:hypothetical protein
VPIAREYTSNPKNVRCNANEPASRFHGLERTTAALKAHSEPSSPMYCSQSELPLIILDMGIRTLVKIFAPKLKPTPNKGLLGNCFRYHFTVCLTSQVARALYKTLLVIFDFAQPLEFTTHASQPPTSLTKGASTCLRYSSCEPPLSP